MTKNASPINNHNITISLPNEISNKNKKPRKINFGLSSPNTFKFFVR